MSVMIGQVCPGMPCPKCKGPLVARRGPYSTFWGCKKYPACNGTRKMRSGLAVKNWNRRRTKRPFKARFVSGGLCNGGR